MRVKFRRIASAFWTESRKSSSHVLMIERMEARVMGEKKNFDQKQRPLFDALKKHHKQEKISFHVPGHKNGLNWLEDMAAFRGILPFDQTEVTGLDYLHEAEGAIKKSQDLLTNFYQSQQSYYLVNGSTVGNLAMILGTTQKGDRVFVDRNVHQSIIHGLELNELRPIFLAPEIESKHQSPVGISLATLQKALLAYPEVKALILTYPTYAGAIYPIEELLDLAKAHNCLTLVDEAHGAHFILGEQNASFPKSALFLGADIVVQSAHKMLPALTQSAYLHIGNNLTEEQKSKVEHYLHMLQSSSPSYLLMLSLEYARWFLASLTAADLEASLVLVKNWKYFFEEQGLNAEISGDPLKLILRYQGLTGIELGKKLEKSGLFPELVDHEKIVLTFPLIKENQDLGAFSEFDKCQLGLEKSSEKRNNFIVNGHYSRLSELELTYAAQVGLTFEKIMWRTSIGRIAAENITPYPPGVPLALKGEKIQQEHITQLAGWLSQGARVVGLTEQGEIQVYLEEK